MEAKVHSLQCCFSSEVVEVSTPQATNHALILISNPRENGKPHKIQFGAIILLEEEIAPKNLLKILQEFECENYFGSLLNFLILMQNFTFLNRRTLSGAIKELETKENDHG